MGFADQVAVIDRVIMSRLGTTATWKPWHGGASSTVSVIEEEPEDPAELDGIDTGIQGLVVQAVEADLSGIRIDDRLVIDGKSYDVVHFLPDRTGLIRIFLRPGSGQTGV